MSVNTLNELLLRPLSAFRVLTNLPGHGNLGPVTVTNGGSLKSLRRTNQERVLTLLLKNGPMHRAEIARQIDVSRATVSTIVNDLIERGVLEQVGVPASGRLDGRVRERVAISRTAGVAAGLDFTLDRIALHLCDLERRELATQSVRVPADASASHRVRAAALLLDETLDAHGLTGDDVIGLGVGVPGQVATATGVVGPSLPGQPWAGLNVREMFEQQFGRPVMVENNTRVEAMAEYLWGAGREAATMLYVNLTSGIGAALVLDGRLYRGAIGGAGELGHLSIDHNGPTCPCGNRGCLVQRAGAPAILQELRPILGNEATIEDVAEAARAGDRASSSVLADVGWVVGQCLASVCNLLDPGRIVVGGPVATAGPVVLDAIAAGIERHAMAAVGSTTTVVQADFEDSARAGVRGGAALVLQEAPHLASLLRRLTDPPGSDTTTLRGVR
ncbi:ROK family transcriptional regulator [Streptomyces sp. NPDC002262]|uniref:ROK family transcriptional regulator n=1 Tax=Streptomyces sp. NPDC002262 TaxID=3154414 RepID=UPI003323639A